MRRLASATPRFRWGLRPPNAGCDPPSPGAKELPQLAACSIPRNYDGRSPKRSQSGRNAGMRPNLRGTPAAQQSGPLRNFNIREFKRGETFPGAVAPGRHRGSHRQLARSAPSAGTSFVPTPLWARRGSTHARQASAVGRDRGHTGLAVLAQIVHGLDQVHDPDVESARELQQRLEAWVSLAALDSADVGPIEAALVAERSCESRRSRRSSRSRAPRRS